MIEGEAEINNSNDKKTNTDESPFASFIRKC